MMYELLIVGAGPAALSVLCRLLEEVRPRHCQSGPASPERSPTAPFATILSQAPKSLVILIRTLTIRWTATAAR